MIGKHGRAVPVLRPKDTAATCKHGLSFSQNDSELESWLCAIINALDTSSAPPTMAALLSEIQ